MPMGFRLNLKWGLSVQPSFSSNNSSTALPSSYSYKSKEIFCDSAKISLSSVICGETETFCHDPLRSHSPASASEMLDNKFLNEEVQVQMDIGRGPTSVLHKVIDDDSQIPYGPNKSFLASFQAKTASQFGQLMKNLNVLEETLADSDALRLEREILVQLEKLGALAFFRECPSRTLNKSNIVELSDTVAKVTKEVKASRIAETKMNKAHVPTVRKQKRKSRRERASKKDIDSTIPESLSKYLLTDPEVPKFSSGRGRSKSSGQRWKIARNEAEMSRGIKLLAELERIRKVLEEESGGQVVSLSIWAEAVGVENKVLQKHLHFGWYCRDQLLKSTRSLVVYMARNYGGLGVPFEDLIQAGKSGVLQGAERFDHTRGYKFSTYVHYWIRKSISMLVSRHSRGIRVPVSVSNAINKIQRARTVLRSSHGKIPDDQEIARFTGLPIAKITAASQCLRVVGSVDQKLGDCARFMELTPDVSITSPEEAVMRQHMIKDIYGLLQGLEPRERQVLVLRFGLGNNQCRSLDEIGRLFGVSKEWIRKTERSALTKLRDADLLSNLRRYLYI